MTVATSFWWESKNKGTLKETKLSTLKKNYIEVQTFYSGISTGTEALVGSQSVSQSLEKNMACNYMEGSFSLPIKYGYCLSGKVKSGEFEGRNVFLMHPHQDKVHAHPNEVTFLPKELPLKRAILIPNLETAINAVWDGNIQVGYKVAIVGGGTIGLLIANLIKDIPGVEVEIIEKNENKRTLISELQWNLSVSDGAQLKKESFDLSFHTSGNPQGLQTAIDLIGYESKVIELSWYGERESTLRLGESFHYNRKTIQCSQVSFVSSSVHSKFNYKRRMNLVLMLLKNPSLEKLITNEVSFKSLPEFMENLSKANNNQFLTRVRYPSCID